MANKKPEPKPEPKAEPKPEQKPAQFVDAVSNSGRVIKVAEDNLDYCVDLKARGRTIKDPHGLLKNHPRRNYIFDK
jgi:hypothetical protein|tara:strand:+ start:2011 stop:2238 length:228 start_codon:yes stop_codon:yes gene_type:complete